MKVKIINLKESLAQSETELEDQIKKFLQVNRQGLENKVEALLKNDQSVVKEVKDILDGINKFRNINFTNLMTLINQFSEVANKVCSALGVTSELLEFSLYEQLSTNIVQAYHDVLARVSETAVTEFGVTNWFLILCKIVVIDLYTTSAIFTYLRTVNDKIFSKKFPNVKLRETPYIVIDPTVSDFEIGRLSKLITTGLNMDWATVTRPDGTEFRDTIHLYVCGLFDPSIVSIGSVPAKDTEINLQVCIGRPMAAPEQRFTDVYSINSKLTSTLVSGLNKLLDSAFKELEDIYKKED